MPRIPGMFLHVDPPDRTRHRTMFTGSPTSRRAQDAEPMRVEIVTDGIEGLREHDT